MAERNAEQWQGNLLSVRIPATPARAEPNGTGAGRDRRRGHGNRGSDREGRAPAIEPSHVKLLELGARNHDALACAVDDTAAGGRQGHRDRDDDIAILLVEQLPLDLTAGVAQHRLETFRLRSRDTRAHTLAHGRVPRWHERVRIAP